MSRISLGLDVGGTNMKAALLSPAGRLLGRAHWPTPGLGGLEGEILDELVDRIQDILTRHGVAAPKLAGLGLACAGLVDFKAGLISDSPNLRAWEGIELRRRLSSRLRCPVLLENDVNALAYGEWRLGAGRGTRHMLCLALGTGVGGGLILDGSLYRGYRGLGAELGHVTIDRTGRRCACGNRGCLEAYAGARQLSLAAGRALARGRRGHGALRRYLAGRAPTPARLSQAARAGNALARELLADLGRALGVAIASYVNIFAPERVILAGGVSRAGHFILDPARAEARSRLMNPAVQVLDLRLRALGDDGAALGAALLARERRP